ncbi:MAG TPA: hypothetical protein VL307_19550 [Chitinophagaceae bacterium]|nr:hypothetical protein [Chitinophagaceae bacterium]
MAKASKAAARGKNAETGIKYSDKSAGQPTLLPVFEALKKLLLPYAKGSLQLRGGEGGQVMLVSNKPVEINGKTRAEYWFAAALVQKGYVGFYFMPVTTAEKQAMFAPVLLQCLKGKGCFHIKTINAELLKAIETSLAKGYRYCQEQGIL